MSWSDGNLEERNKSLETEVACLKQELEKYKKLVDCEVDEIIDGNNDEKQDNEKNKNIDWSLIRQKLDRGDDEWLVRLISDGKIDIIKDTDPRDPGRGIFLLAIQYGRLSVIKLCMSLGATVDCEDAHGRDTMFIARNARHHEIVEYLVLQKLGGGKANEIIKDCDTMYKETGVLESFMKGIESIDDDNELKEKLVQVVIDLIKQRHPISSFLTNLAMRINPKRTWNEAKKVIKEIIYDTKDSIGWHYLRTYLINNTFLFREYDIIDHEENKDNIESERSVESMNAHEFAYYVKTICVPKANINKNDGANNLMVNTIIHNNVTGKEYLSWYDSLKNWGNGNKYEIMYAFFLSCGYHNPQANGLSRKAYDLKDYKHKIPTITPPTYRFDELHDIALNEANNQANKDIKEYFMEQEKNNKNNWEFLKNYGKNFKSTYDNKRLRQDLLKNGVISTYTKNSIVRNMTHTIPFDAIKFVDLDIYLNSLMLRNCFLDDHFQKGMKSIFDDCGYRRGPLKQIARCRIKTETDYSTQEWPNSACLLDIIRCTISFNDINSMIHKMKIFENQVKNGNTCIKEILRVKNGFQTYNHEKPGYTDIKYNVRVSVNNKDVIAEVQFLLNGMAKFKVKAHKFYGVVRQREYLDNLKLVRAIKNDSDRKLMIAAKLNNHKIILDVIIRNQITNIKECFERLNSIKECLKTIYLEGHVKCIKIFVNLCETEEEIKEFLMKTFDGSFSLMWAAQMGRVEMVKYLTSLCNDKELIWKKDVGSMTPFMRACHWGRPGAAAYLLTCVLEEERAKMVHMTDNSGKRAINFANERIIDKVREWSNKYPR